jgi:hypothetical protein
LTGVSKGIAPHAGYQFGICGLLMNSNTCPMEVSGPELGSVGRPQQGQDKPRVAGDFRSTHLST